VLKKPIKYLTATFLAVVVVVISLILFDWFWFMNEPLIPANHNSATFMFVKGSSFRSLAMQLHSRGLLQRPLLFILLGRVEGVASKLQAGEYSIEPGLKPGQLLDKLAKGKMILHSFTIVPGWTFHQVIDHLESDIYVTHTLKNLSDRQIMHKIERDGRKPEGLFYPSTYNFSGSINDTEILQKAYDLMQNKLAILWNDRYLELPYTNSYQALIVASMIERETDHENERELISGVIINRLHKHMNLEIDPTVIYGLGKQFHDHLTLAQIKKKTKYNTYLNPGLPPTPICMPGEPSIYAALHPHVSNYLYYVSKNDGTHVFSPTYKQHAAAVAKYQPKVKKPTTSKKSKKKTK
jgi:UPF0755 protein